MNETTDAPAIFAPLWRRKWLILLVALLVGIGTYLYYKRQPEIWSASTQVYLGAGSEEAGLLNGSGGSAKLLTANSANQVVLINSSVAEGVHKRLHQEGDLKAAKGTVKAKAPEKGQFITITAEAASAHAAVTLANATASAYLARSRANYLHSIGRALEIARRQLHRVEATQRQAAAAAKAQKGASASAGTSIVLQAAGLSSKVNQLEAEQSIRGVQQVSPAKIKAAVLLSPKPRQNAIFGLILGFFLAAVAAYVLSRFDRRLRSLADVEAAFQTQILAGLPGVRRPVMERDGGLTPARALIEPLRRLHTSLQLEGSNGRRGRARVILFISADPGDGKSSTVANLARVQRDAGERVAVIEADFRRPVQARLLRAEGTPGLAEVLEGARPVGQAMQSLASPLPSEPVQAVPTGGATGVATAVGAPGRGTLSVLVSGGSVANPPALLASPAMGELLTEAGGEFDSVLIDAPSPLEVSDVIPLLAQVDGVVLVARLGHTREISARRLLQLLENAGGASVLGAVANAVPRSDLQRYGYAASRGRGRRRSLGR